MTLAESGTLDTGTKVQYLHTLVCGEALHKFDLLSADVESTDSRTVEYSIKGLAFTPPPVNLLRKQKRAVRRAS